MLTHTTPPAWRKGYTLHRRRTRLDSLGETQVFYDMEHPDLTVLDGTENAVCWQDIRVWRNGNPVSSGDFITLNGELPLTVLQGALFSPLTLSVFDRLVIDGEVYELRKIQRWSDYRWLQLQRV